MVDGKGARVDAEGSPVGEGAWGLHARVRVPLDAIDLDDQANNLFVDLREENERVRDGIIAGSVHLPYQALRGNIKPGGLLAAMATNKNQHI